MPRDCSDPVGASPNELTKRACLAGGPALARRRRAIFVESRSCAVFDERSGENRIRGTGRCARVLLGGGVPLFHNPPHQVDLALLQAKALKNGCVYFRYQVKRRKTTA